MDRGKNIHSSNTRTKGEKAVFFSLIIWLLLLSRYTQRQTSVISFINCCRRYLLVPEQKLSMAEQWRTFKIYSKTCLQPSQKIQSKKRGKDIKWCHSIVKQSLTWIISCSRLCVFFPFYVLPFNYNILITFKS